MVRRRVAPESAPSAQTAERALSLLDVLANSGVRMRLSDLAQVAALNISTTSRLVGALERSGLVERDLETGRYGLGFKLLRLAHVVLEQSPLPEMATPILSRLMEATGETATLCVVHNDAILILARVECASPLRSVAQIGHQGPLYCTAHGKVALAWMADEQAAAILAREMPKLTDLTITSADDMNCERGRIRDRGYALDLGEREPELVSIAAPVRDAAGQVVASCGVSGARQRMTDGVIPALARRVLDASDALSVRLGYRPPGNAEWVEPKDKPPPVVAAGS
jgi:DNA-binding IclR family transcriptional regulator